MMYRVALNNVCGAKKTWMKMQRRLMVMAARLSITIIQGYYLVSFYIALMSAFFHQAM